MVNQLEADRDSPPGNGRAEMRRASHILPGKRRRATTQSYINEAIPETSLLELKLPW
jgi:hypothetical protein